MARRLPQRAEPDPRAPRRLIRRHRDPPTSTEPPPDPGAIAAARKHPRTLPRKRRARRENPITSDHHHQPRSTRPDHPITHPTPSGSVDPGLEATGARTAASRCPSSSAVHPQPRLPEAFQLISLGHGAADFRILKRMRQSDHRRDSAARRPEHHRFQGWIESSARTPAAACWPSGRRLTPAGCGLALRRRSTRPVRAGENTNAIVRAVRTARTAGRRRVPCAAESDCSFGPTAVTRRAGSGIQNAVPPHGKQ